MSIVSLCTSKGEWTVGIGFWIKFIHVIGKLSAERFMKLPVLLRLSMGIFISYARLPEMVVTYGLLAVDIAVARSLTFTAPTRGQTRW